MPKVKQKSASRKRGLEKKFTRRQKKPMKKASQNPEVVTLLREVDEYQRGWRAAKEPISDAALGRRINYGVLIERLRDGGDCKYEIILRLRRYMKANPAPVVRKRA